jgi:2-dehydropantoate 2-reductase
MRVAVFGAGAIGGYVGALLRKAGVEVTLIARGAQLAAIQANGVTVKSAGQVMRVYPACTDDTRAAGVHDYVIVALKAQAGAAAVPGVIEHLYGDRFVLGEPNGEKSERVRTIAGLFRDAGLKAPVRDIRREIWLKLWGNVAFNPISALTGQTLEVLASAPDTRALARRIMLEAQAICTRLGIKLPLDVERRIDGTAAVGAHRTSMLQDLEQGRSMEIDAVVGAVQELGVLLDVPTPALDVVLTLVKHRAQAGGCY